VADDDAPFYAEDRRGLLNFACGTRPDWDRHETWQAMHAAHDKGIPWPRICKRLLAIAFRDAGSSPLELRDEAGQRPEAPRVPAPDSEALRALKAGDYGRAQAALGTESVVPVRARLTGPQAALPPEGDAA
jgi:hypothetical protein